jgi:predicted aspartyl protease
MFGVVYPLLLLNLPVGLSGSAPTAPPQDPELISRESVMETTMLMLGEADKRLTVPVAVNARGPYNFIIDTGAERTVVSRELAATLGLNAGSPVTLLSMTGRSQVDTVLVPDLIIKSIGVQHSVIAPKLEARNLGAIGLLGIDTLRDHQVSIDFEHGTMEVRKSEKRANKRRAADEIVVTAKSMFGQLIVTDAYYGDTRIQVVLDTGSQVSMGNSALRKRVARYRKTEPIELTDVTGEKTMAGYTSVPNIKVGDVMFGEMPVAFADVAPFERFGLTKRPALLLGMDALRSFRRVDIDFPNRQVRFHMPKDPRNRSRDFGTGRASESGMSRNF